MCNDGSQDQEALPGVEPADHAMSDHVVSTYTAMRQIAADETATKTERRTQTTLALGYIAAVGDLAGMRASDSLEISGDVAAAAMIERREYQDAVRKIMADGLAT